MDTFWVEVPRDAVRVVGPDAQTYLHSQVSQDLRDLAVGGARWSFLLQPNGKVDVLLRIWRTGEEEYVLDTDAGFGDEMTSRLNRFRIRVKAEIEPLDWRCIALRGDGLDPTAIEGGLPAWGGGVDLLGADVSPPDGIEQGSADQLLAARIEAAWPAMGSEIRPGETIPAETGVLEEAVSFTKGCYPGQELVERMDGRGAQAPRTLRVVDAPDGTAAGDPVLRDGTEVGRYTSVSGTRALALIRRNAD